LRQDLISKDISSTLQCNVKSGYVINCDYDEIIALGGKILALISLLEMFPNSDSRLISK
jgi:hypothetical protein